jgi:hypothetical protein
MATTKPPSPRTEFMDVVTSLPYLRSGVPADTFRALRAKVNAEAGFDFLAICADLMRHRNFSSKKPGVANRSRHKCGDAFDYNIASPSVVAVREDVGGHTYFRSYIKTAAQDGSLGMHRSIVHLEKTRVRAYFIDFTAIAGAFGWHRIPAHKGWKTTGQFFSRMEYWHYQNTEGIAYDDVMKLLYP